MIWRAEHTAMASEATSDEEPDWLEVPGPEQVWNAAGFFTQGSVSFEEPLEGDMAYQMITTLEERELAENDLCVDLLHLTPVASRMLFHEPPPPPCSTLADCLLRRAATLGRPDTVALFGHADASELLLSAAAGSARKGARDTPIKTRAQRAGIQLEETPPAVRRDITEGGPVTRAKAKAQMRAIQKGRVQRVMRAEQAGTVSAALFRANDTERKATKRASEPSTASGSRRVYTCKKCGEPKKGHVCKVK